ncbi:hypothetical protein G5Y08_004235 [Vibrio parahaemolyticus]|nr:hypothetical protein [Vibrio parahaemolyticus]EHD2277591.1 hypothetical protein [Vibrio parahaemolyticus]EHH2498324.1 hypothetical protein [Vibrio parahaemolyticus]EID4328225.1 hypothetical protein [Vibrio parahaemolyticus]
MVEQNPDSQPKQHSILKALSSSDGVFSVFKVGLASTGLSGLALLVFWLLLEKVLDLEIFSTVDSQLTALIVVLLLILISGITFGSIRYWYLLEKSKIDNNKWMYETHSPISFTLPNDGGSFGAAAEQLGKIGKVIIHFENFDESAKKVTLQGGREVKAESTKEAIEMLGELIKPGENLPTYEVVRYGGTLTIKGKK